MVSARILAMLLAALVCAPPGLQLAAPGPQAAPQNAAGERTPVLVELFTSEGCSSCPPADTLLAGLEEQQPIPGVEVVALEEHVDYWDQLGWVDPFSGSQWTLRQQDYAAARHDNGVYTPQMIVNGQTEFVGSRERQAHQIIRDAASKPGAKVSITAISANEGNAIQCRVTVGDAKPAANDHGEVWLAITETGLHSAVKGGENSGLDVRHGSVARALKKVGTLELGKEPAFAGDAGIKLDKAWKRQNLRAVVFVQEKRSRHILGAAAAAVEPDKPRG